VVEGLDTDHRPIVRSARWTLGGRWRSGGQGPGFAPAQLAYANDMRVELIAPHQVEVNDFLRRFLDRSGPGPHHLTFKVDDLAAALDAVDRAGHRPVGVDLRDPTWKEAFLHPKDAAIGIVVQLAEAKGPGWLTPPPDGFPADAELAPPSALTHLAHAVADLDHARGLFADLLGGQETATGEGEGGRWVELAWPASPGRIRLLSAPAGSLGDRPGRVHHLAFACPDPDAVPDQACGTRLVLSRLR
jgi:Glyoxalase/Bleomycin resistance protein/Dioxygenase superfamily